MVKIYLDEWIFKRRTMAEPRRIELMPAEPPKPTTKKEKRTPAFRFRLSLTESTDKTCPEFSYAELLKNVLVSM